MRTLSLFVVLFAAAYVYFITPIDEWNYWNPRRDLWDASVQLDHIGLDQDNLYLVEEKPDWTYAKDTILAEGVRTENGWVFHVGFPAMYPYRVVQIRTADTVLLDGIHLRSREKLNIRQSRTGYEFTGTHGAFNSFIHEHSRLAWNEQRHAKTPAEIDTVLQRQLRLLTQNRDRMLTDEKLANEIEWASYYAAFELYRAWGLRRLDLLLRTHEGDTHPERAIHDSELTFLAQLPALRYGLSDGSTQIINFVRDWYFQKILQAQGKNSIDGEVLQAAMDSAQVRFVCEMRSGLQHSIVNWIIANKYSEAYPRIGSWVGPDYNLWREFSWVNPLPDILQLAMDVQVAAPVPPFTVTTHTGERYTEAACGGAITVLYFLGDDASATGRFKSLSRLQQSMDPTEIRWVAIAPGRLSGWIKQRVLRDGLPGGLLITEGITDGQQLSSILLVGSRPTAYIIGRDGTILDNDATWLGGPESKSRLARFVRG